MAMMVNSTVNETRKGLIILWDYKFSVLIQLAGIFMIVIGIMFFAGQGNITREQIASTLLGFIITFYGMETLSNMSWALMNEAQSGTLEQMYMSPAPSQLIVLGRSLASIISATIQLVIMLVVMIPLFNVSFTFSLDAVVILLITMIGLLGFGYVMGGLTLIFKQIGPLANIIQNIVLMANGTFLPVAFMPVWMAAAVKLIPSTLGIIALRQIVLDGKTLADLSADGTLLLLTGHSVGFFILGWFIFALCERIARQKGNLGQY
jgi:ABC-2 type transport system permease protein